MIMAIVTGGAGFIGSNIVRALNQRGCKNILVVDNLKDGRKFKNLLGCEVLDYMDQDDFLSYITNPDKNLPKVYGDNCFIKAIFHEGACSATTEWDGQYMMKNNYDYSKAVLHYCLDHNIQFIYASSAATYGANTTFKEESQYEKPLNVYGYSKYLFDQYVRSLISKKAKNQQMVGCRYFNVYGPREFHKGDMASVAFHLNNQLKETGIIKLFEGCDGYEAGEQRRDFVYVDDVAATNIWFYEHPQVSGIFNVGTGKSQSFNDIAKAVLNWHQKGALEYRPFPEHLKGRYQSFTEADISKLREVGCDVSFRTVEAGVKNYLDWLAQES